MSGPNFLTGPTGGVPSYRDGGYFQNITTNGYFQVKASLGVLQRVVVNTGGTTSSVALYDGLSSTVTITIATPGVITWPAHGLNPGTAVLFETTGALPTGLTAGTTYYVTNDTNYGPNTFAVSDTQAHALAGTNQINTSGSQSGTQTGYNVSKPIGTIATTAQPGVDIGAYFASGLLAVTAGGAAANITVVYN